MSGRSSIRGSRVGAGTTGAAERGETADRERVQYYCAHGHASATWFAADAEIPDIWDCPHCGCPAGRDEQSPPAPVRAEPYKSHLAYVQERRTEEEAAAILEEALARRRASRGR